MPQLTDLITRFTFDVDKKGVATFDQAVSVMTRRLLGLGSLIGITFGARQIGEWAQSGAQAGVRLASSLGAVEENAKTVSAAIKEAGDELGELGDLFKKDVVAKNVAADFFGTFDDFSAESIERFKLFSKTATLLSVQTGSSVQDSFRAIMDAAKSGTLEPLQELPGITNQIAKQFEFVTGLVRGADPIGAVAMEENLRRVSEVLDDVLTKTKSVIDAQKGTEDFKSLVAMRRTEANVSDAMGELSGIIVKTLSPAIDKLADAAKSFGDFLESGSDWTDRLVAATNEDSILGRLSRALDKMTQPATPEAARRGLFEPPSDADLKFYGITPPQERPDFVGPIDLSRASARFTEPIKVEIDIKGQGLTTVEFPNRAIMETQIMEQFGSTLGPELLRQIDQATMVQKQSQEQARTR